MNMRNFWWLALAFTLMWMWLEWSKFTEAQTQLPSAPEKTAVHQTSEIPAANTVTASEIPQANTPQATQSPQPQNKSSLAQGQRIHVSTDLYDLVIDTHGGDIRIVKLKQYKSSHDKTKEFELMSDQGPLSYYAQNGIVVSSGVKLPAPTHKSIYKVAQTHYEMVGNTLSVPLTWQKNGVSVTKVYTFKKGEYTIGVHYDVKNTTQQKWVGSLYSQLVRSEFNPDHQRMMYTYTGPVLYDPNVENKYEKHKFSSLAKDPVLNYQMVGGWTAMIQHYFISAVIPNQKAKNTYYIKPLSDGVHYVAGTVEPAVSIAPGQSGQLNSELYIGPIIQDKLDAIAPGLERTVDYGILTVIADPIFWTLEKIHSIVGNWGWSIIFLTILIKLLFYKLSATSYRSMARMKKFQPKLKQLKENYGDDKALFQQKMMALYKEEKINPLGGCLPILVQMPVFISLYWVVLYSAEIRQAPWMFWIQDLSAQDPYYILPIIMGITMYVQQKLNPSAMMDEMQQKVMKFLPFIFTVFFMFFPAGLVLYWVVNNILSVAQQWYITKQITEGEEK